MKNLMPSFSSFIVTYQTAKRTRISVEVEGRHELCCIDLLHKVTSLTSIFQNE